MPECIYRRVRERFPESGDISQGFQVYMQSQGPLLLELI